MENHKKEKIFKLGLALSGGGAKGFAHLGVFQALNEKGLFPEIISGTSAGAFAGVFYADGYTPEEIKDIFDKRSFTEFAEFSLPQGGFFKSTRFQNFLKKNLRAKRFEDLKIPMRVITTDIESGESRVFSSGPLIPAIVASCTVPIIFQPVQIDNRYYVDGGLLKNFPVSTIRSECERIVGVNVSPIIRTDYKNTLKYVAERSFHHMSGSNTLLDRKLCDYLIESNTLSTYSMFDLEHVDEIFQLGYNLAIDYLENKKDQLFVDFPQLALPVT